MSAQLPQFKKNSSGIIEVTTFYHYVFDLTENFLTSKGFEFSPNLL
ncbi:MAG: hypothetical protein ABH873_03070 [Candidatus Firestonebacteria bacterium]